MTHYEQALIIGKSFFVTSQYAKNIRFKIVGRYDNNSVYVNTWGGRNSSTGKPIGKITNAIYSNETIFSMIRDNVISFKKLK